MIHSFATPSGLEVERHVSPGSAEAEFAGLRSSLDTMNGVLLSRRFTFPDRYRPGWAGFVNPPLKLVSTAGVLRADALNRRGDVLVEALRPALGESVRFQPAEGDGRSSLIWPEGTNVFAEIRRLVQLFNNTDDEYWGLYGAFGYDLALDQNGVARRLPRAASQQDLALYVPDRLIVCEDPARDRAEIREYDFTFGASSTVGLPRDGGGDERVVDQPLMPEEPAKGSYRNIVRNAVEACRNGELFEVVASQCFRRAVALKPSEIFEELEAINPSPYGFLANLGGEHILGTSPEMFVRVRGKAVESCPISGTLRRGANAQEDADQIFRLLSSKKAEAELTMSTDLDVDDKARVCEPGSVSVVGRRQIEMYSHVIHTVDHVRGTLRADCDAMDAIEAHLGAVTLTGAPRAAALEFIEANETAPRFWYGGAVGRVGFDGDVDTGIILRALRVQDGVAEIRVGASLLHSSDPEDEEAETLTKAGAMFEAISGARRAAVPSAAGEPRNAARGGRFLLVDLDGPFVQALASLARLSGWEAQIVRREGAGTIDWRGEVALLCPALGDDALAAARTLTGEILAAGGAVFGVGHGMLAVAEHLGAVTALLEEPLHGDRRQVFQSSAGRFIPAVGEDGIRSGNYYRRMLAASRLPGDLVCVLADAEGNIAAIEHRTLPAAGVLFQPQSTLSSHGEIVGEALDALSAVVKTG